LFRMRDRHRLACDVARHLLLVVKVQGPQRVMQQMMRSEVVRVWTAGNQYDWQVFSIRPGKPVECGQRPATVCDDARRCTGGTCIAFCSKCGVELVATIDLLHVRVKQKLV